MPPAESVDGPGDLLSLAVDLAEEAGRMLTEGLTRRRTVVATKSTATDLVTEMDRASEALIVRRLQARRPHDGLIGEEGSYQDGSSGVQWVVDPLDGTTNYVYGYPGWNVSIGVLVDGRPAVGVVHVPGWADTFAAAIGRGATRNGRPIHIGDPVPLEQSLIGTGFNYDAAIRRRQATALGRFLHQVRDVRRSGAAASDLCAVAAGRLDAFYEHGLQPWDHTAGSVVAREAGARAETWAVDLAGSLTVAAHPDRFDDVVAMVAAAGLPT